MRQELEQEKTLAYLIPSVEWAIKNKKRVVISTNTINLQEQLLNKDIPIAKKVVQGDFRYILVKGRGNYLCNRKYFNLALGENVNFEEFSNSQKTQFKEIITWGKKLKKGINLSFLLKWITVYGNYFKVKQIFVQEQSVHTRENVFS